ncbi:MAG TPA: ABC transporter permease [Armatimonadota bacterium]|jgi:ABC-2 type transport system permease protein
MSASLRRIRAIAKSEGLHLLREPRTLMVILVQPVMLLVLYGYAISFDLQRLPFAVWDQDRSEESRTLVSHLNAGGDKRTLELKGYVSDPEQIEPLLSRGEVRFVLVLPVGLGRDLRAGRRPSVQALIDGADANTAGVAGGYLSAAIATYNSSLMLSGLSRVTGASRTGGAEMGDAGKAFSPIDLRWRVFYNPDLNSRRFIIPGLMAILLTIVAASLTSTTIARERELGSIESLLTSPISALDLVIGKMAPYVVVALGNVTLVLLVGGLVFQTWPRGDLFTLGSFSFLFLLGMLAIGMAVSAVAPTQQLALLAALLATMLPNFFLTGFTFPRSNMPVLLQWISAPIPATSYLVAIRGVFLKGVGWSVLWPQGLWMLLTTLALLTLTVRVMSRSLARGLQ